MNKKIVLLLILSTFLFCLSFNVYAENGNETEENITEEMVVKTTLTDCFIACRNEQGCVCPSECKKTGEIEYKANCGGKKVAEIKEVSLCDGCMMDDICLDIGSQKQTMEGGPMFYCSSEKSLEKVKLKGESCKNDYECLSYTCLDNKCVVEQTEEGINLKLFAFIVIGFVAAGLGFFIFKFILGYEKITKDEKKMEKEDLKKRKGLGFERYKYRYKPEYDTLEKELKESLKRFK